MFRTWVLYLYREIVKNFLLVFSLFFSFLLVIEIFERLSAFLTTNKPFFYFVKYLFWKMIVNIFYIFPYALVLSFIFTLFLLSRSSELLALISLGFRREELCRKFLLLLLILSILGEMVLNLVVPTAFFNAQKTWISDIEERKALHLIFRDMLFLEGENFLLIGRPLEPKGEYLSEMTVLFFEESRIKRLIWAERGIFHNTTWRLKQALIQEGEKDFSPEIYESLELELPFNPQLIVLTEKPLRFLSLRELYNRYQFLNLSQRPLGEIWAELFNRALNLLSGFLLGTPAISAFLFIYTPGRLRLALMFTMTLFFISVGIFLLLQTISQTKLLPALILLIAVITAELYFLIRTRVFPFRVGKRELYNEQKIFL